MPEYLFELESGLRYWCREGTNDQSTTYACAHEDEYELADEDVVGKLVFDVGAYTGGVSVWLSSRGAHVVALEPVPTNADLIRRNADLNGVVVTVIEGAAGESGTQVIRWAFVADPEWNARVAADPGLGRLHDDQVRESIRHHGWVGTTHRDAPVDQSYEEREVPSLTLGDLASAYGVPDIIKIDCEGGEWPWLSDPLVREVDLIVGEWHPWDTVHDVDGVGAFRGQHRMGSWSQGSVTDLLGATHDVSFSGPLGGPGGFRARIKG